MPAHYRFVDQWEVAAPVEAVFDVLADGRTYPQWWIPVYQSVEGEGEPAVGGTLRYRFKGRLPYTLTLASTIVRLERPREFEVAAKGDLTGRGVWTVTPTASGAHVRFDWQVELDRPLLRAFSPVLRPLFRWNHNWTIQRAIAGLEPYARRQAEQAGRAAPIATDS